MARQGLVEIRSLCIRRHRRRARRDRLQMLKEDQSFFLRGGFCRGGFLRCQVVGRLLQLDFRLWFELWFETLRLQLWFETLRLQLWFELLRRFRLLLLWGPLLFFCSNLESSRPGGSTCWLYETPMQSHGVRKAARNSLRIGLPG